MADAANENKVMGDRLRVIFASDFDMSLGDLVYPVTDPSKQVATAGLDASGTGHMELALNGALERRERYLVSNQ